MKYPPFLQPQDCVAVLGTAGSLKDPSLIDLGISLLQEWGLIVEVLASARAQHGYFAGNDDLRRSDLQEALDRKDIRAVFCARGGYGTTRILDRLDFSAFSHSPKWLVGFSDITALHLKIQQLGFCSLHAPTLSAFLAEPPEAVEAIKGVKDCLFGNPRLLHSRQPQGRVGEAIAPLIGGNLSLLSHTVGSLTEIDTQGKILFLEEVGEYPYKVDRHLTQLHRAGLLQDLAGVAVGDMDLSPKDLEEFGFSFLDMLLEKLPFGIPIALGFPFGHIPANHALVPGAMSHLSVKEQEATLTFVASGKGI